MNYYNYEDRFIRLIIHCFIVNNKTLKPVLAFLRFTILLIELIAHDTTIYCIQLYEKLLCDVGDEIQNEIRIFMNKWI